MYTYLVRQYDAGAQKQNLKQKFERPGRTERPWGPSDRSRCPAPTQRQSEKSQQSPQAASVRQERAAGTMSRSSARREPSSARSAAPKTVGNYTLLQVLGQGTFGEVLLAFERQTRESVAVKVLERDKISDDDARQRLANEISILHRVHHAHLLQLLEVIEEVDRIYLVTEHVGGGELFNYIVEKGRIEEAEAAKLFAQMVAAVDSCHRSLVRWAQGGMPLDGGRDVPAGKGVAVGEGWGMRGLVRHAQGGPHRGGRLARGAACGGSGMGGCGG